MRGSDSVQHVALVWDKVQPSHLLVKGSETVRAWVNELVIGLIHSPIPPAMVVGGVRAVTKHQDSNN